MTECVSRDNDYCCEFEFNIKDDYPCRLCPYIEKPKKKDDKKKEEKKDG